MHLLLLAPHRLVSIQAGVLSVYPAAVGRWRQRGLRQGRAPAARPARVSADTRLALSRLQPGSQSHLAREWETYPRMSTVSSSQNPGADAPWSRSSSPSSFSRRPSSSCPAPLPCRRDRSQHTRRAFPVVRTTRCAPNGAPRSSFGVGATTGAVIRCVPSWTRCSRVGKSRLE